MRDILLTLLVFGAIPLILQRAYVGIYVWSWLSYMNPHRATWGFAYTMPFAQIVAITLLLAILFDKNRKDIPVNGTLVIWLFFLAWMSITTFFALNYDAAITQYSKVIKIQLLTFITMMLIRDKRQMDILIWVIVASIGFYSVKGGIFTIATGGASRVWGPPNSFIEENNTLALATLMIIPLMFYLYRIAGSRLIGWCLLFSAIVSVASVLGSQSRGALVSIVAVGVFFWLKSRSKILSALLILVVALAGWNFMPESWHERMDSISEYQQDSSAMGRINAWWYSYNVANDRLTGGGLESWGPLNFSIYAPNPENWASAHSIYFSVLADHGWIGLIMFLSLLMLTWRSLSHVINTTKHHPQQSDLNLLARMMQVSFVAYGSGGAFLSLSYFDLPWHLIAIAFILRYRILDASKTETRRESLGAEDDAVGTLPSWQPVEEAKNPGVTN